MTCGDDSEEIFSILPIYYVVSSYLKRPIQSRHKFVGREQDFV